jgi:hypothetical protein
MKVILRVFSGCVCFFDDRHEIQEGNEFYWIPVSDLRMNEKRREWVRQLSEKTWFTPEVKARLMAII